MMPTPTEVLSALNNSNIEFTTDQLRKICDAANERFKMAQRLAVYAYLPGQPVKFDANGLVINGEVIKANRTTVTVRDTATRRTWRVSPSLLRKA